MIFPNSCCQILNNTQGRRHTYGSLNQKMSRRQSQMTEQKNLGSTSPSASPSLPFSDDGSSEFEPGSMPVEGNPEDSVTCEWSDCGSVSTHLPSLVDHIHNGEYRASFP